MLVFATSDKGGTGRSVTSCNIAYRKALQGTDTAYLDFDFGSPTAGSIFDLSRVERGTPDGNGLHSYLLDKVPLDGPTPEERLLGVDVWGRSDRASLRGRPDGAGRLFLYPGDKGGGEFDPQGKRGEVITRCIELFRRLNEQYELIFVDLSAGRSTATDICLEATADDRMEGIECRWLVFHRWTRQHVIAAEGLVYGDKGILKTGVAHGHDFDDLRGSIRFVRTAVVDPRSDELSGLRASQVAWLEDVNQKLMEQAGRLHLGRTNSLGSVPLDPVLQWREQLISDSDTITRKIANQSTVDAFEGLAKRLSEDWGDA